MDIRDGQQATKLDDGYDDHLASLHLIEGCPNLSDVETVIRDAAEGRTSDESDQVGAAYDMGMIARSLMRHAGVADSWVLTPTEEIVIGFMATISGMAETLSRLADAAERQPHLFARPHHRFGYGPKHDNGEPLPLNEAAEEASDFATKLRDVESALKIARAACDQIRVANYAPDPDWRLAKALKEGTAVALYRWRDGEANLLYIGITESLTDRELAHSKGSSWYEFAASHDVEWFPTRADAETAETAAIRRERPLFNSQHNNTPEARQRLVAYLVEHDRLDLLQPAVSRG